MWPWVAAVAVFIIVVAGVARVLRNHHRPRLTIADAIERLDLSEEDVRAIKNLAYREVAIPKRDGGRRTLQIPDEPTRNIQRRILHRLLARARCHRAAVGFERGKSIVDAARPHTNKDVVIRIDVVDFFSTTTEERVTDWFQRSGWEPPAAKFLTRCVTHRGVLPQGAPTSPRLSNLVNARMDGALWHLAERFDGDYTRYADDITLSFNTMRGRTVRAVIQIARRILKRFGYQMHGRKTRVLRAHQRQTVLGLTVNTTVAIPRQTRRRLRAARHRVRLSGQCTWSESQLAGWSAFEQMVERQR
jgi:RNA-directed DNA polymerase